MDTCAHAFVVSCNTTNMVDMFPGWARLPRRVFGAPNPEERTSKTHNSDSTLLRPSSTPCRRHTSAPAPTGRSRLAVLTGRSSTHASRVPGPLPATRLVDDKNAGFLRELLPDLCLGLRRETQAACLVERRVLENRLDSPSRHLGCRFRYPPKRARANVPWSISWATTREFCLSGTRPELGSSSRCSRSWRQHGGHLHGPRSRDYTMASDNEARSLQRHGRICLSLVRASPRLRHDMSTPCARATAYCPHRARTRHV